MARLGSIRGSRGAQAAFRKLVEPHLDAMYAVAYRLTRNRADAEDLVQDVCVRAYPRLSELEAIENPRAWLLRVLYRLFVDLTRHRRASPVDSLVVIDSDDAPVWLASDMPGPDAEADSALGEARLEWAWRRLDHIQRVLLAMHDIEGYSLAELEEMTGFPQGTLKSRLHRARVRLGRLLNTGAIPVRLGMAVEG